MPGSSEGIRTHSTETMQSTSPSRANYGMSVLRILNKINLLYTGMHDTNRHIQRNHRVLGFHQ